MESGCCSPKFDSCPSPSSKANPWSFNEVKFISAGPHRLCNDELVYLPLPVLAVGRPEVSTSESKSRQSNLHSSTIRATHRQSRFRHTLDVSPDNLYQIYHIRLHNYLSKVSINVLGGVAQENSFSSDNRPHVMDASKTSLSPFIKCSTN